MSEIGNTQAEEHISFKEVLGLVDTAVFTSAGKHLSHIEIVVLQGSWQGQRYSQIADRNGYALDYLKNDIGPQLWKRLSKALGEKVSKANLRVVIEQRIYQQQQENKKVIEQDVGSSQHVPTHSNPISWVEVAKPTLEGVLLSINNSQIQPTKIELGILEQASRGLDEHSSKAE